MEFYPFKVDPALLDSADASTVIAQAWGLNNQVVAYYEYLSHLLK